MANEKKDARFLMRFWERLRRNPSYRSVQQLFPFLEKEGIPVERDGTFLAYKSITHDNKDQHTKTIDNSPGTKHIMPRNLVSDDPKTACHFGFHVGSLNYASRTWTGAKLVICRIDPEHVVCVPYDHNAEKMRVCQYEVVGYHGDKLPSTVFDPDPEVPKEELVEVKPAQPESKKEAAQPAPEVKEEKKPEPKKKSIDTAPPVPTTKTIWKDKFDKMGAKELMEQGIVELRKYAGHDLHIVGAYKLNGGKEALVAKIMELRHGTGIEGTQV